MTKQATRRQQFEIGKRLEQVCKATSGGFCEYEEGWDDARIASLVGCLPSSVRGLRKELIGKLRAPQLPNNPEMASRISALQEQMKTVDEALSVLGQENIELRKTVEALSHMVGGIVGKHNSLANAISLSRLGLDVRNAVIHNSGSSKEH